MKSLLVILVVSLLQGCILFAKFSGTDVLHKEGKKSKSYTEIKRLWCSQCGCEAIKINQYEKSNLVTEMLLNCTKGCPPGERSYKIKHNYKDKMFVSTEYYFLVTDAYPQVKQAIPLSYSDSVLIRGVAKFNGEAFYKAHCTAIPYQFRGYIKTDASQIVKFPTGEKGLP